MLTILCGDVREKLAELPDESVQCCVTSPPYFGLRDYGTPGQIGLEKTPEEYVATMVAVFREVRRVLKDGTLWLNLGDSYAAQRGGTCMPAETLAGGLNGHGEATAYSDPRSGRVRHGQKQAHRDARAIGLKHKDLVGIPWRVAFALQADGWWLRSDIIWAKANCMPESVTDRPTRSHEYLFLLAKSEKYFYDAEAIKEPASEADWENRAGRGRLNSDGTMFKDASLYAGKNNGKLKRSPNYKDKQRGHSRRHDGFNNRCDNMEKAEQCSGMRNKRDVWTVAPANYPEAHFATFPPDLIKPCILAGSRPGDTILDPFAGSGTTGMVALELGRRATLIELNPAYVKLIEQRCNVTPGFQFK